MTGKAFAALRGIVLAGLSAAGLFLAAPASAQAIRLSAPGAPDPLAEALRDASALFAAREDQRTTAQDLFAAAQADYARLLGVLYEDARYAAVISIRIDGREAAEIPLLESPDRIRRIEIAVRPGPQFTFATARMRPYARETDIPPVYGDTRPAYSTAIREAAAAGVEGWRQLGHAKARIAEEQITADHPSRTVSSLLLLDPGPRVSFGQLQMSGYARMRPERLAAIAGFPTGRVFSPEDVALVEDRLRRSGVFRTVSLSEAEAVSPGDRLDFSLVVEEAPLRRFGFGAEVASFDGIGLSGYWLHRNLLGGGERLRFDGAVSGIAAQTGGADFKLALRFDRPATLSPDNTAFAEATAEHVDDQYSDSDRIALSFGLKRQFRNRLEADIALAYIASDVTDRFASESYRQVALPMSLSYDRRDVPLDPTAGWFARAEVKPFLGLGSTGSGVRLFGDLRYYRSLGGDGRAVLAGRLQAGTVMGPTLLATPREDLFFSGGGGTVRGHPYQSLGVRVLRAGNLISGGQSFLGASGELRLAVTEKIGLVGFADAGAVAPFDFFTGGLEWHSGAGIGLRYATPIGPIRLDVATPIGGRTGNGVQLYVGLGQSF
ncbi:MAG: hypothetical protein RLZZ528_2143 [Pseudomonadota bacterium]